MNMEDRIRRWREETHGEETEGVIDLLCDAEEALRRRAAALVAVRDWLELFSVPPTSTITEKNAHVALIESALTAKAK